MAEPQYGAELYEWSSGNLIYRGGNTLVNASESDASWYIFKYTWDSSGNLTNVKGPIKGAWSNRAGLAW